MAHTKAAGSTKLGRDSRSKRLGVKVFAGQTVKIGDIIVRQRGTRYMPGVNVNLSKDHTIFAAKGGIVNFTRKNKPLFTGGQRSAVYVNVE